MKGKVICELLNLRRGPEVGDNVATTIPKGTEVTIVGDAGEFCKVKITGVEGYVMKKFIEPEQTEIDENGNFVVDGKVIGYEDGDDVVVTDEETIKETLETLEGHQSLEQTETLEKKAVKKDGKTGAAK